MADTLGLEPSAKAWEFKSLLGHHGSMAELVDAPDSKSGVRKDVEVRVLLEPPKENVGG